MRVAVVDGQGGGIGKAIVEKLKQQLPESVEVVALGTNALATSSMLKAGADEGATGENAIMHTAAGVDVIIGTVGIIAANSMLGELSPGMARAIAESGAKKILLPLNRCNIEIAGTDRSAPLPQLIDSAVQMVKSLVK